MIKGLIQLLRPKQWLKNLVIFVPVFFDGRLLYKEDMLLTLWAFISLCFASSSIYIFNDIVDQYRDKLHPIKKHRPIPSGKVSNLMAITELLVCVSASLFLAIKLVKSEYFLGLVIAYIILMIVYTLVLKHVGILDTISIAVGFVIRVFAGAIVLQLNISSLLVLTIIGAALLISFGKRKAEIANMKLKNALEHRPALKIYPKGVLDSIISGLFSITFISYTLFAYNFSTDGDLNFIEQYLPPRLHDPKWFLLTVPFAFYVLTRYLILTYREDRAGVPEDIWFTDGGLIISISSWFIILFVLIYLSEILRIVNI